MGAKRTCTNCGSTITCGCQLKTATDGTKVCSRCIRQYEQKLKAQCQPIVQTVISAK